VIRNKGETRERPLRLVNSGLRPVAVMDIHPTTIDTCTTIQFTRGVTIQPQQELVVATISYQVSARGHVLL